MNNFFASVECAKDPSLAGKPVAVCGSQEMRHGIVLAKNYLAKSYGVATGDTIHTARSKCRELVIVPPDYDSYIRYSKAARKIYLDYTDLIEPFGIDECWLDVTGSRRLFGDGSTIAEILRERIKRELGVTISVGVSFNKIFAKLGSDMKKPDAVTCIERDSFREKIGKLPVCDLFGVGRKTGQTLKSYGIFTIGQLADAYEPMLTSRLGKFGHTLKAYAMGLDDSPVLPCDAVIPEKTIGHGTTPFRDMEDPCDVWTVMLSLCEEIGHRLIISGRKAGGVSVSVRDNKLEWRQYQCKLPMPTNSQSEIAKAAFSLFMKKHIWTMPLRTVTVTAIDLVGRDEYCQTSMFDDVSGLVRSEKLDTVMDGIRRRYGRDKITYGVLYGNELSGITRSVAFGAGARAVKT